jgi:hypothetical protein
VRRLSLLGVDYDETLTASRGGDAIVEARKLERRRIVVGRRDGGGEL